MRIFLFLSYCGRKTKRSKALREKQSCLFTNLKTINVEPETNQVQHILEREF